MKRRSWGAVQPFRSGSAAPAWDDPDAGEAIGVAANTADASARRSGPVAGPRGPVRAGGPAGAGAPGGAIGAGRGGVVGSGAASIWTDVVASGPGRTPPAGPLFGSGPATGGASLAAVAGRGARTSGCARTWRREGWCERRLIGRGRQRRGAAGWSGSWARVAVAPDGPPGRPIIPDRRETGRPHRSTAPRRGDRGLSRGGSRRAGRRRGRRRPRSGGSHRRSGRAGSRRRPSC